MDLSKLSDREFDALYPLKLKKLSSTHWTPVAIARKAIEFLEEKPGTKVLDLGSGAGKFCLVAASCSQAQITGVEQRENLVRLSREMAAQHHLQVKFIHSNIMDIDFKGYDAFYFFNSFEENIDLRDKLEAENTTDEDLYLEYCRFLHSQFELAPVGTRIATYCGNLYEIPDSYTLLKSSNRGKLNFWEKRV
jgi:SAM-dependent methyltransferase